MRAALAVVALATLGSNLAGSAARAEELPPGSSGHATRLRWPQPALGPSRSGAPEVLFTFDDGPEAGSTESILDSLQRHKAHAIFFLVGRRLNGAEPRAYPIVQRMLDEGHVVGNHTVHHAHLCMRSVDMDREIDDNTAAVRATALMEPAFFRAPYGARCARLERGLAARGLFHMHWDVDPQEWRSHDSDRTAALVISKLAGLADGQRAVILIHDTHPTTAQAVPHILDWIEAENARRVAKGGRRPILILDPSQIAVEQLAPGVEEVLTSTATAVFRFVPDLGRRLVRPMTPGVAKANL